MINACTKLSILPIHPVHDKKATSWIDTTCNDKCKKAVYFGIPNKPVTLIKMCANESTSIKTSTVISFLSSYCKDTLPRTSVKSHQGLLSSLYNQAFFGFDTFVPLLQQVHMPYTHIKHSLNTCQQPFLATPFAALHKGIRRPFLSSPLKHSKMLHIILCHHIKPLYADFILSSCSNI
jgi:hypothetical protein